LNKAEKPAEAVTQTTTTWKTGNTKKSELNKNAFMGYGADSGGGAGMAMSESAPKAQLLCKMCKAERGTLPSRLCKACKMMKCDTDDARPLAMEKADIKFGPEGPGGKDRKMVSGTSPKDVIGWKGWQDYSHHLPDSLRDTHELLINGSVYKPKSLLTPRTVEAVVGPKDGPKRSDYLSIVDYRPEDPRHSPNAPHKIDDSMLEHADTIHRNPEAFAAIQSALKQHMGPNHPGFTNPYGIDSQHPTSQRASKLEADTSQPGKVEYTGSPRKLELSELDMLKSYEGKGDSRGSANGAAVHSGETVFGSIKTPPTFSSIKAPSSKPAAESPMEAAFAGKQKADISKPKASVKQMARAIGRSQSVLARSEDYIDVKHENEKGKRLKNVGAAGTTPDDKKVQEPIKTQEGSGGDIKPNGLKKMDMKAPPAAPRAANSPSQKVAVSAKQPTMKNDDSWQAGLHEARTGVKDYKPNHGMDEFPKPTSKTPPRTPATIRYDIPGRIAKADLPSTKSPFPTPGKTPGNTIPPASGTIDTDVNQANKQIGGFKSILSNPTSGIKEGTGHLAALRSRASSKKIAP